MRKTLTLIATAATCAFLSYALWNNTHSDHDEEHDHDHDHDHPEYVQLTKEQLESNRIQIHPASPGSLKQILKAPAQITISNDRIAHIIPKVSGAAVKAYKNIGERVKSDEIIASLDSREMAEAKSAYLTAAKKEQLASNMYSWEQNLHEKQLTQLQDYHTAESRWQEAAIDKELAKQKLCLLGLDDTQIEELANAPASSLRMYELRSPIEGQVIDRHIMPGEFINTDDQIYVIADLSKLWVEVNIFAKDRQYAKVGQQVSIVSSEGKKGLGRIVYLSPIVNEQSQTSTAIAEIDNTTGEWLPGTFVQAELITTKTPVNIAVPKEAIQNIDGEDSIFVLQDECFYSRPVTIGQSDETHCEIISGLNPGDQYAATNTFLLKAELKKDEAEHMD